MESVADYVNRYLSKSGLSRRELAKQLNCHPETVRNIIRKTGPVPIPVFDALMHTLFRESVFIDIHGAPLFYRIWRIIWNNNAAAHDPKLEAYLQKAFGIRCSELHSLSAFGSPLVGAVTKKIAIHLKTTTQKLHYAKNLDRVWKDTIVPKEIRAKTKEYVEYGLCTESNSREGKGTQSMLRIAAPDFTTVAPLTCSGAVFTTEKLKKEFGLHVDKEITSIEEHLGEQVTSQVQEEEDAPMVSVDVPLEEYPFYQKKLQHALATEADQAKSRLNREQKEVEITELAGPFTHPEPVEKEISTRIPESVSVTHKTVTNPASGLVTEKSTTFTFNSAEKDFLVHSGKTLVYNKDNDKRKIDVVMPSEPTSEERKFIGTSHKEMSCSGWLGEVQKVLHVVQPTLAFASTCFLIAWGIFSGITLAVRLMPYEMFYFIWQCLTIATLIVWVFLGIVTFLEE